VAQPRFGVFSCDTCGAAGGIFRFLLNINKYSLQEALDEVRGTFGLRLDAPWTETRWKEILQDTDFDIVCNERLKGTQPGFDGAPEQPPIQLSYSMLLTYLQCPYRYKKRYLDHQRDERPISFLSLGRSLHLSLASFLRGVLAGKTEPNDADFLLQVLRQNWISQGYADEEEERDWFARASEMLVNYANSRDARERPFAIERAFRARLGRLGLFGKIDRIDERSDGTYEIIDYKVGGFDSPEELQARELQTAFYYLGATHGLSIKVSLISYHYLSTATTVSFDHLPDDVFRQRIETILDTMNKDKEFKARQNLFCQNCRFTAECPLRLGQPKKV